MHRRLLIPALLAAVALTLTGCASTPKSSLDLLHSAKAAGISCPNPEGDKDEPGAESVVCGNLELTYFSSKKARKDVVVLFALGAKMGLGDEDTRRFLLGDSFLGFGPSVKLQQLQQKVGGSIYTANQVEKHL